MLAFYEKTIYLNESNGFCIFRMFSEDEAIPQEARDKYCKDDKIHFSVTGYHLPAVKDIMLNLSAHFDEANSVIVDKPLKDSQEFEMAGFKIKVIHTPGHTVGSCCYIVSDENKDRLFSGDTIFYHSYGRTDFPTGSGGTIIRSILDKLLVLDGGMEVFPGHGDTTTIDEEKKWYRRDISGNIN